MKVSELRIGNIIKHNVTDDNGDVLQPNQAAITEDDMEWMVCYGADEQEPVPITNQYLFEFGFKEPNLNSVTYYYLQLGQGYYLHWDFNDQKMYLVGRGSENGFYLECKFLHQLQNIFFALTGKELQTTTKQTI